MKRCLIALTTLLVGLGLAGPPADATSGIHVTRHGVVTHSVLPSCAYEDGSGGPLPCSWNLRAGDGNGVGLALYYDAGGAAHYVWKHRPTGRGWHWVNRRWARALSVTEGHRPRYWKRCVIKLGDTTHARCADGTRWAS